MEFASSDSDDAANNDLLDQEEDAKSEELLNEEEEDVEEDLWHAKVPDKMSTLRACIPCLLIKTLEQFNRDGCENCNEALKMQGDMDKIWDCTTADFEGMIAMMNPEQSWVAGWQFMRGMPGCYAIYVKGSISDASAKDLEDANMPNVGQQLQERR